MNHAQQPLLREFLSQVRREVRLQDASTYRLLGVKWYGKGVFIREEKTGKEIKADKLYEVRTGDFIYTRLFAWKSSFALVTEDFDGCLVSNEFPTFVPSTSEIHFPFLLKYVLLPHNIEAVNRASGGMSSISRKRYKEEEFLALPFPSISLKDQITMANSFASVEARVQGFNEEVQTQTILFNQLRQTILQEAIEGKLTAKWREAHPVRKGDPEYDAEALLEQIKAEKQKLIADGKIKKEKPLPPIKADEMPFQIPQGWLWCRLGEIIRFAEAGKSFLCKEVEAKGNSWGVIKTSAITSGYFVESENKLFSDGQPTDVSKKIRQGDLLFCRASGSKGLAGRCCIVQICGRNLLLSDKSIRVSLFHEQTTLWTDSYNKSTHGIKYFDSLGTQKSTSMNNVTREDLLKLPIPLPSLVEQKVAVEHIGRLLSLVSDLEAQVSDRKAKSEDLMQAVLREAFEGNSHGFQGANA